MKYRVDINDVFIFLLGSAAAILGVVFFTSCCYPEQKPTVVWELHEEAINGVAVPNPSPLQIDIE